MTLPVLGGAGDGNVVGAGCAVGVVGNVAGVGCAVGVDNAVGVGGISTKPVEMVSVCDRQWGSNARAASHTRVVEIFKKMFCIVIGFPALCATLLSGAISVVAQSENSSLN